MELNQRLKMYRENKGITLEEMAVYVGTTKNHISAIERGVNRVNANVLIVYADRCEMPLDELVGRKTKLEENVAATIAMDIMDIVEDVGIKIPQEKELDLNRLIRNYLSEIDTERVIM